MPSSAEPAHGTPLTRRELIDTQLSIFDKVGEFCRENHVRYYLWAGSLLGAVRHGGYIPWDDDLDVAMIRPDYDRFCRDFPRSPQAAGLSLHTLDADPAFRRGFAKIADPSTLLLTPSSLSVPMGVNIDVFPLDQWPVEGVRRRWHHARMRLLHDLVRLWTAQRAFPGRPLSKRLIIGVASPLLRGVVHVRTLTKAIDRLAQRPRSSHVTAANFGWFTSVPVEVYGEPLDLEFEGRTVPGPADPDAALTAMYGDWRTPPPVEERTGHERSHVVWVHDGFAAKLASMPPEERARLKSPEEILDVDL